ncbi:hypothetical protein ACN4EG_01670 [Alkalinema pantanalense CENA528]|uniref:hypothetical protein n=1 Tax=Alkalinema pantanalense TaxID=1620705 RepID=UPI003D6E4A7D
MMGFAEPTLPQDWLLTPVQRFLSQVNWEGIEESQRSRSLGTSSQPTGVDPNSPLPLSLTVSQFMTAVNWEGAIMVDVNALPTELTALDDLLGDADDASDKEPKFTLTDFSDLF